MGWFWGHFCQDILHKLALAVHVFEERGEEQTFDVILESRSHANVLALVQAVLGGNSKDRVLLMSTRCIRGNARECPYYIRSRELIIVEYCPNIVNNWRSDDDIEDAAPWGLRVAQRRVASFFNARF
jgi:hypothetical protein